MISFQAESFAAALPDITPMIDAHWEEVGSFADIFDRKIDFETYLEMERQGKLLTITGREDGQLIGYFVGVMGYDLHRVEKEEARRVKVVSWLVYYIEPAKRGWASALVKAAEREAGRRGVRIVNTRVKRGRNAADAFFAKMGYAETEVLMTHVLPMDSEHAAANRQETMGRRGVRRSDRALEMLDI